MVESDKDQKTEEPTGKRINDAREEGQIATSKELSTWFIFIGALLLLGWLGPYLGSDLAQTVRVFIEKPHQISMDANGMQDMLVGVFQGAALPLFLVYMMFWSLSIVGTMIQTGFYVNPNKLKLDYEKIMPMKGFKNIFSMNSIVELLKAFAKMVVLGYLAFTLVKPMVNELPGLADLPIPQVLAYLKDHVFYIVKILMIVITVIAIADYLYVRYTYFKNLRMTKQEVKDEHKQLEGDPMIKSRLRRIRIEKSRQRMMAKVPKAKVVVTNPTHYAIALEYERGDMFAPIVSAKGVDFLAKRIREIAEENEVPMVSNPPLARALYDTVDLDQPIQPEHYKAVAEVISYVYKLQKQNGK